MFRICKARYADLTGLGAAKYPGRWNEVGTPALYTSTELSTAVLEVLSRLPKHVVPKDYAVMKIRLSLQNAVAFTGDRSGSIYFDIDGNQQPLSEIAFPSYMGSRACILSVIRDPESAEELKDTFGNRSSLDRFAVFLPSAVVPAYNVVLFPHANGFRRCVRLESVEPFEFHPGLFLENAEISDEV